MKILMVHNHYQQPGGEDSVFSAEVALLRQHGNEVHTYVRHNDEIVNISVLRTALKAIWNNESYWEIIRLIRKIRPDVVHFQNIFFLISPAAYHAARAEGLPVVQTIHNYRLLCPKGQFFRDDEICEMCLHRFIPWPGILHKCYRDSLQASTARVLLLFFHRIIKTWRSKIDIYIALTEFARKKFIQGGFSSNKIMVKSNFVFDKNDRATGTDNNFTRNGALFVGRLSREKGIHVLLNAWERLLPKVPLTIIGDGPLTDMVVQASRKSQNISWSGYQKADSVLRQMGQAGFLVFPSIWYEGMPMTIIESYMRGLPVIASYLGAMSTIIEHQRTGLHFQSGNVDDLASKVQWAYEHPAEMARMGWKARLEYEAKYTPERNYGMLMAIYKHAIEKNRTQ